MRKELGRINYVYFGLGDYNDACLGIHFTFEGQGWGVNDSKAAWDVWRIRHTEHCKWTERDRDKQYVKTMRFISTLLKKTKVKSINQLQGKPVEITFEDNTLKSWRILEEVL